MGGDGNRPSPDDSWTGGSSINWSDGGNWTGSTPSPANTVGFNVAGAINQPTLDVDPTVAGLLMNSTGNNTLTLNNHTLTITGLATQSGGILTGAGAVVAATYNLTGGTIAPGNGIGTIAFTGNFAQGGGSTYQVDVDASRPERPHHHHRHRHLERRTVAVQAANGTYQRNTTYTILTAGTVTGTYGRHQQLRLPDADAELRPHGGDADPAQHRQFVPNGAQTPNQRAVGPALDQAARARPATSPPC